MNCCCWAVASGAPSRCTCWKPVGLLLGRTIARKSRKYFCTFLFESVVVVVVVLFVLFGVFIVIVLVIFLAVCCCVNAAETVAQRCRTSQDCDYSGFWVMLRWWCCCCYCCCCCWLLLFDDVQQRKKDINMNFCYSRFVLFLGFSLLEVYVYICPFFFLKIWQSLVCFFVVLFQRITLFCFCVVLIVFLLFSKRGNLRQGAKR